MSGSAEQHLQKITHSLKTQSLPLSDPQASAALRDAKRRLLQLNALTPSTIPSQNTALLTLARETYEQGALAAIRAKDADSFTRYVNQLSPFYELPPDILGTANAPERNKVTGLYLLLLLTQGLYDKFHSELEALTTRESGGATNIENDPYLGYPIKLERWLMEGSYDRVWKAMKKGEVPCEEYGVFSDILTSQIRSEIASSSERAYPSLPLASTKSLLFLDSEGAVVDFCRSRNWTIKDGHIYFPSAATAAAAATDDEDGEGGPQEQQELSKMVIQNTLGYARELETIV
ncbi:26S proteasome regulatory subunit rpn12 [Rhypophila decipiens]|uniref:26S proteasome regulatory subunit rpn12 n=1 Tax=Rhypophila decipiens TaxID=261697 RepID=A0AAN6YBL9_9PEZI|nr:26S proteasome regulatory subunit rpn12 [Rhypophila decipiens]